MLETTLEPLPFYCYFLLPLVGIHSMMFGTLIEDVIVGTDCQWLHIYVSRGLAPDISLCPNISIIAENSMAILYKVVIATELVPDVVHLCNGEYSKLSEDSINQIEKYTCLPIEDQIEDMVYTHMYILALRRDNLIHDFVEDEEGEYIRKYQYERYETSARSETLTGWIVAGDSEFTGYCE